MPDQQPASAAARDDLADLTAAPEIVQFDGQPYQVHPLDLARLAQLRCFARQVVRRKYQGALAAARQADAPAEHVSGLQAEMRAELAEPLSSDCAADPDVVAFGLWLRLQAGGDDGQAPDFALCRRMLADPDARGQVFAAVRQLNAQQAENEEGAKNS